ncbi:hypothetical protein CDG24_25180 [Salmonella enterica subsp. enterica serovar Newport]|nr:hypothetical protein [Salmonella enterica subsp. enterica serovar Newport]
MKYREYFEQLFKLDENSPTWLSYRSTGEIAGRKVKGPNPGFYTWSVRAYIYPDGVKTQVQWTIPRCVYELFHGVELTRKDQLIFKDGNKNNLSPYNMTVSSVAASIVFDDSDYSNVVLPAANPDYFKHFSEWTDPEALELLEAEKKRRLTSPKSKKRGRPRKWN